MLRLYFFFSKGWISSFTSCSFRINTQFRLWTKGTNSFGLLWKGHRNVTIYSSFSTVSVLKESLIYVLIHIRTLFEILLWLSCIVWFKLNAAFPLIQYHPKFSTTLFPITWGSHTILGPMINAIAVYYMLVPEAVVGHTSMHEWGHRPHSCMAA